MFHADRDSKAAALNERIIEIRAALASLEVPAAAPVNDADFDLEAMFPVPPTTSRRSSDARVAHTTNKRGW
ncbi:MAG: hypothetical protein JNK56_07020 [Myxococcales bacterium]|nr:hypothetical protein [Myxococcales bacterium]